MSNPDPRYDYDDYEEYDDIVPRSDEEQMYDDDCRERAEDMREELR